VLRAAGVQSEAEFAFGGPAGGQGMNTGIQETVALAARLTSGLCHRPSARAQSAAKWCDVSSRMRSEGRQP
jgi:2-polyprenyl-6-methoxyphenol hydroxylase-like FAD-dependent oxidoreductase